MVTAHQSAEHSASSQAVAARPTIVVLEPDPCCLAHGGGSGFRSGLSAFFAIKARRVRQPKLFAHALLVLEAAFQQTSWSKKKFMHFAVMSSMVGFPCK